MEFFAFAFAFNAKSFAIVILVFFFFPPRHFFWTNYRKLFSQRFNFSYQENVWPRFNLFLGHTRTYFRKNYSSSCYSRRVWHMTVAYIHGYQHAWRPKKHNKLPEPTAKNSEISYSYGQLEDGRRCKGQNREKSSR